MYFPLLRSKQFELLALREVAPFIAGKPISPILEPTKADTTLLLKALTVFIAYDINFSVVLNSCVVGKETATCMDSVSELVTSSLKDYTNFQIAINVNHDTDFNKLWQYLESRGLQDHSIALIHLRKYDKVKEMEDFIDHYNVKYNILHIENVKARYGRNFNRNTIVSLTDSFNQQQRNADYINIPDEIFSEEYMYYKEENYIGFSDYLTVGEQFSDSGFTPYVVVIHLTYLNNKEIRIAHFASSDNKDTNSPLDLPRKFKEALLKLTTFVEANNITKTKAIDEFISLKDKNHYPGLGSIKKLSIMNHLELVSNLI